MFSESYTSTCLWGCDAKCGANIKEDRTQTVCVCRGSKPRNSYLKLKARNFPFVNHIKCLDVVSDRLTTLKIQRKTIDAKVCRTFLESFP